MALEPNSVLFVATDYVHDLSLAELGPGVSGWWLVPMSKAHQFIADCVIPYVDTNVLNEHTVMARKAYEAYTADMDVSEVFAKQPPRMVVLFDIGAARIVYPVNMRDNPPGAEYGKGGLEYLTDPVQLQEFMKLADMSHTITNAC